MGKEGLIGKGLDFSERKLKVNVRYYLKNTSYLLFLEIVLTIIAIFFTAVFARVMSQEDYGIYNFLFSVIGILSIASLQGINISMMRSVSQGFEGDFIKGTKVRVKWSLIGTVAMFAIAGFYYFQDQALFPYFMLGGLFFTGYSALGTYSSFLFGKSKFKLATKLSIIFQGVTIGIGGVVIYFVRDLFWILFYVLFMSTLMQIILIKYAARQASNKRTNPETISYGKHLSLNQIAINVLPYTDRVIIGGFMGFVDVAIYSIGLQLSEKVKRFLNPLTNVIFPNLSKMEGEKAFQAVRQKLTYFTILGALISILGIVLSPVLIPILFTEKYSEAVFFTQILFVTMAFVPPALVMYTLLQAQKRTRELYYYNVSASVMEIGLMFILIAFYGIFGAVVAKLATRIYMLTALVRLTTWKKGS